ncbi:TRM11 family SAM-dependent methyltransferase [Phytomonospora endophytica]|uniref:Methyltransferase n=1 Tax=Phytomonospora endophytica TaxID=714109 RepID=A0A841FUT6_9ACTN|nr:class I SAM-dependent methyltransferase [Phytomonospora endophytica]MBB6038523.1 tRNA G10 N-methylase Trm11 [Phytomonospora endophytica]GIG69338.1 hypothetical protein Pen01_56330 [Phytomonospora endophytica]
MSRRHRQWGSVWATAQDSPQAQRRHYVRASTPHPAKMLPAIARHAIGAYTSPGDLVLDPMCGIGTTLVEALRAGRHACGVELEPRWSAVAAANLRRAGRAGLSATMRTGDARGLPGLFPDLHGRIDLVVTSPPYGPGVHGRVMTARDLPADTPGLVRFDRDYGHDRANLAHRPLPQLLDDLADILTGCSTLLAAHGRVVVATRPFRVGGELVDLPGLVTAAAHQAGLVPAERCVALLAAWRRGRLASRPSFFALDYARRSTSAGRPVAVIVHEDILVFTKTGDQHMRAVS